MKKSVIYGLLTASVLLLGACQKKEDVKGKDTSLEKVKHEKKLVVATSGTLFPSSYYNDKNELVGYGVEISKEIGKRLGVEVEFKEYNVDGQTTSLQRNEADFAANDFNMTKDREKNFTLSDPIKYSFSSIIVRKSDQSGIHKLEDLKDKKIAGEPNTIYMKIGESYGGIPVTYDNATNDQYLRDVANGRTDAILNDYYLQKMAIAAMPEIPVEILKDVYFNADTSGLLFEKNHQALKEEVNKLIKDMREDGTLKTISEKYFYADISVPLSKEMKANVRDN